EATVCVARDVVGTRDKIITHLRIQLCKLITEPRRQSTSVEASPLVNVRIYPLNNGVTANLKPASQRRLVLRSVMRVAPPPDLSESLLQLIPLKWCLGNGFGLNDGSQKHAVERIQRINERRRRHRLSRA